MTQHQTQSHFSRVGDDASKQDQAKDASQEPSQGPSLSPPASPDATSPYHGPEDVAHAPREPEAARDEDGLVEMTQPHYSEAQSTLAAFAPAQRTGDPFPEPEDPQAGVPSAPQEQPAASQPADGREYATPAGTVRGGMAVVDSYGHAMGIVAAVEGERLRLASTDPLDDGVAFLPLSLVEGIDGDRVLIGGRGDASFGLPAE